MKGREGTHRGERRDCQHSLKKSKRLKKCIFFLMRSLSYQSRFGKQEWLQPYTSETLTELGARNLAVDAICPAFAADCLETLEEISQENREIFLQAGGKDFEYIPCLNDSDAHSLLLRTLVEESFLQLS